MEINPLAKEVIEAISTQQLSVLLALEIKFDSGEPCKIVRATWNTRRAYYSKVDLMPEVIKSIKTSLNIHLRENNYVGE